jgi:hypothetical protein
MAISLNVVIVEKTGILKSLTIKDFKEEELFKKCGFKKSDDFINQVEWNVKLNGIKYIINVYAKSEGRANNENKYDFPPPIDNLLFYGSCAIVAKAKNEEGKIDFVHLSLDTWEKIYEKLFGGFESLAVTAIEDEEEIDELENISKDKKTKQGYLKDGFVIDSDGEEESEYDTDEDNDSDNSGEEDDTENIDTEKDDTDIILQDIGSELSEESYDYN